MKTSSITLVHYSNLFTCNRRRKSACWRSSWQVFPNIFSKKILMRISLISVLTVLMCNDFLLWSVVETRLILQESVLELLLQLGWYLIKVEVLRTWSPPIILNFLCGFGELSPMWSRSHPSRELFVVEFWRVYFYPLLKVGYKKVPFQTSHSTYQTYSRSDSGNSMLPNWWNFNRNGVIISPTNRKKPLTQMIRRSAFSSVFFADICNSSWNPSTVEWSIATVTQRCLPLFSVPLFSSLKSFERWGVDSDFAIIPWSTSQINAKFQEMIPCLPWEVLFHHGSLRCQIHDSASVIVSRFTSLN